MLIMYIACKYHIQIMDHLAKGKNRQQLGDSTEIDWIYGGPLRGL